MIGLIIFFVTTLIGVLYVTVIDKNFFKNLQKTITDYANEIINSINPLSDSLFNDNIPLMKTNLFVMTFNKNIDLYNTIYNSSSFNFLITYDNSRNINLSDFDMLIPSDLQMNDYVIQSKANLTKVNNSGFSKFFLDLSNNSAYLLDYWNIFYEFMKPLLIVNSNDTDANKIAKLTALKHNITYDTATLNNIKTNMTKISVVIFNTIVRLSNITIGYKQIVDLDNNFIMRTITETKYNTQRKNIIDNLKNTFTLLNNNYLSPSEFEYSYVKTIFPTIIGSEDKFIEEQNNSNYINIYRMFSNIDDYETYYKNININILDIASNPTF